MQLDTYFNNKLNNNNLHKDEIIKDLLFNFLPDFLYQFYKIDKEKTQNVVEHIFPIVKNYINDKYIITNYNDFVTYLSNIPEKKPAEIIKYAVKMIASTINYDKDNNELICKVINNSPYEQTVICVNKELSYFVNLLNNLKTFEDKNVLYNIFKNILDEILKN